MSSSKESWVVNRIDVRAVLQMDRLTYSSGLPKMMQLVFYMGEQDEKLEDGHSTKIRDSPPPLPPLLSCTLCVGQSRTEENTKAV